ncbi:hypothetical protein BD410DRAFT_792720 [Rickenella mellea]|uniref:Histidine kinase n=1 Tax=Rickenella mellea TaxID=50990 RepID=A0A4Y7PV46_9AGAM|nr:hypothetical protein BD410DRAFT_792720 [Rickenella mellea]
MTMIHNLPYLSFVTNYPHPAFILNARKRSGNTQPSLQPVFGNLAFRSLLLGPDVEVADSGPPFLRALTSVNQAQNFALWVERAHSQISPKDETFLVELSLSWTETDQRVELELTRTLIDECLVCTSVPRTAIPRYVDAPQPPVIATGRAGRDFGMRLPDFPPPVTTRRSVYEMTPTQLSSGTNPQAAESRTSFSSLFSSGTVGMRELIDNHDWSQTPLGPRSSWPTSLRTVLSAVLTNPFPSALWWGRDLILLYNDAYAEMAGTKHPRIFAQHGSEAWAEIWDNIGPIALRVFEGEAVAKKDDLLFFNRLTDARLPEECYHSWNWLPIEQEDGKVGGFLNGTFDTTQKVVTERRMEALRGLSSNAALCRTQAEFASAILDFLNRCELEAPFAAFYFASTDGDSRAGQGSYGPRTSYIRQPIDGRPVRIKLRIAGTVGIPTPHSSVLDQYEICLDPLSPSTVPIPTKGDMSESVSALQSESETSNSPGRSLRTRTTSSNCSPDRVATNNELSDSDASTVTPLVSSPEPISSAPSLLERLSDSSVSSNSSIRTSTSASSATVTPASVTGSSHSSPTSTSDPSPRSLWPFIEAFTSRRAVHAAHLPPHITEGFAPRGWGEIAREAVVIPIAADDADVPGAVLILGLNSRRPYDDDYASWIDLTRVSLNALLTAVKGRESDALRAEQLAQLDDAKTSFFSNASHELRTPLTLISGPLQDTIALATDPLVKENLKLAQRNVTRLARLVDSLMDFSKIAANKLEGRFKPVELGSFTADLASLFRSVIEKSHIEYVVDCEVNEDKICYIDKDFWEKVVFNLIGNAFKYTLKGSINVSLEFERDHAQFHVRDTGVGIPQQDIGKVFDRFHRVDSVSRSYEGTGIGLSLTKELVRLHGGTLTVSSWPEAESAEDHGSLFTVTIPVGKDHLPPSHIMQNRDDIPASRMYARGIVDEATHWSTRAPGDDKTPSDSSDSGGNSELGSRMDPSTLFFDKNDVILLVEDSSDMRRYMKSLLAPYCKVVEAPNGQEALQILNFVKPSLILTDVMMPIVDGYELIATVRQRPDTRLIPMILVTAKEGEESRVEGLLSGADDYLGKPFNSKELIARVHLQMQLGKRRAELEAKFLERTREIHLLSDLSPVGIFRAGSDGRMLYVNPRWWEISGHRNTMSIDDWPESVTPTDNAKVLHAWHSAVNLHKSASLEFCFKNGNYAKGQFEPLITDTGECTGVIGTITDVSDQRLFEATRLAHAQEREATARRRAEEAEERRREADRRRRGQELLIDVTSHELRQPVSAILNCSSLVRTNLAILREDLGHCRTQQTPFTPSQALIEDIDDDLDALDAIYQCGLAQERIANDVLSLSRLQLEVLSIQPVECDLALEVQRIVSIFRNEVKMKRIGLDVRIGQSFETLGVDLVKADKSRFSQVITNLLSNGIKFTDTSTTRREILVTAEVSRHAPPEGGPCVPPPLENQSPIEPHVETPVYVYVAVRDSGPGLNPDDLALLFQRFQQGSNSHNVFGGSGLGLFVSRKLCDLMGGRIDVDSVYGEGATFRFYVQATTVPRHSKPLTNGYVSQDVVHLNSHATLKSPRQLHILITEDNLINQTVLNRQLRKAGCTTTLASNGLQAIDHIRAAAKRSPGGGDPRGFDAILMDCEMPVMDGLTAVREIRKLEESGEIPSRNRIFALTGNARAGQVQSIRDAGMDDVLIKPYKLEELLHKISDC